MHTPGEYYVAERCRWNGDVRMIRTTFDTSATIGVTNDRDAPLFAAAPQMLAELKADLESLIDLRDKHLSHTAAVVRALVQKRIEATQAAIAKATV